MFFGLSSGLQDIAQISTTQVKDDQWSRDFKQPTGQGGAAAR